MCKNNKNYRQRFGFFVKENITILPKWDKSKYLGGCLWYKRAKVNKGVKECALKCKLGYVRFAG